MDSMEEKLGSILNDPETMQKIMSMAQALGGADPQQDGTAPQNQAPFPDIDLNMLQRFSGLARQGSIDKQQQNLLQALNPYLSRQRIQKLENAMRAAAMAKFAAAAFGGQGMKLPTGR